MSRRFTALKRQAPSYKRRSASSKQAVALLRASAYAQARNRSVIGRSPATRGASNRNFEVKSVDVPYVNGGSDVFSLPLCTTLEIASLNTVQEGAGFYNRIGRRINMKSVHITGQIVPSGNATGAGVAEYLRIMLIYDRQPNGALPGATDVLADYGQDGNTSTTAFSHINMNNVERFAVLRDMRVAVPENGSGGATQQINSIVGQQDNKVNWFVKLKDLETHYKSNSNPDTVADIATGHLFIMTLGNVAANANYGYTFDFNARLRFTDL